MGALNNVARTRGSPDTVGKVSDALPIRYLTSPLGTRQGHRTPVNRWYGVVRQVGLP
jgi:hypothetical protein